MIAEHGKGFAAINLPICKYCSVVAFDYILDQAKDLLFIDGCLATVLFINRVTNEFL